VNAALTAGMSDAERRMLFDLLWRVLENAKGAGQTGD
jgi:hypothetical protein